MHSPFTSKILWAMETISCSTIQLRDSLCKFNVLCKCSPSVKIQLMRGVRKGSVFAKFENITERIMGISKKLYP